MWSFSTFKSKESIPPPRGPVGQLFSILLPIADSFGEAEKFSKEKGGGGGQIIAKWHKVLTWQYNLNLINGQCRNHLSQIQTKPALDNFKENNDKKQ